MNSLGGDEGKPTREIETHLVAENAPCTYAGAICAVGPVGKNQAEKILVLPIKSLTLPAHDIDLRGRVLGVGWLAQHGHGETLRPNWRASRAQHAPCAQMSARRACESVDAVPLLGSVVNLSDIDLGDLPTWLALVGASAATYVAIRVFRIEQARDALARDERRRQQATLVAAWLETSTGTAVPFLELVLRNASPLPAYGLIATAVRRSQADRTVPVETVKLPVLAPGNQGVRHLMRGVPDPVLGDFEVSISFNDAAGQRWIRSSDGALLPAPGPAPK